MFQVISLSVILIIIIGVFFYISNAKIKREHIFILEVLKKRITLNEQQISKRENSLSNYNFLKYNLSSALIIQPSIRLK